MKIFGKAKSNRKKNNKGKAKKQEQRGSNHFQKKIIFVAVTQQLSVGDAG